MDIKKIRKIIIVLITISIIGISSIIFMIYLRTTYDVSNINLNEKYEEIKKIDNNIFDIVSYEKNPMISLTQDEVIECTIRYIMENEDEYKDGIKEYNDIRFLNLEGKEYKIKEYIDRYTLEQVMNKLFYLKGYNYKKSKLYNSEVDAFIADYREAYKSYYSTSEVIGIEQNSLNEYTIQVLYGVRTRNIKKNDYYSIDYKLRKNKDGNLVIEALEKHNM